MLSFLNEMYTKFDKVLENHKVYKVHQTFCYNYRSIFFY